MKTIQIYSNFIINPTTRQVHARLTHPTIVGGFAIEQNETITTSKVKLIDFERKYLLTQNTTYFWE